MLILALLLVFLNGFFVAAEFAIVKVRASQLEVKKGNPSARLAQKILSNLDSYLAATQLGITLASLGLGWVGEPVVAHFLANAMDALGMGLQPELAHDLALPIAFAIITVLHIVFGELAPKSIAIQRSESTTLFIAYPLQFFYIIFKPFIWVLNGISLATLKILGIKPTSEHEVHSSDELRFLVQKGGQSGAIEQTNYDIIQNAFSFSAKTVRQVMVPRVHLIAIDLNEFSEADLEVIIEEGYSRIPCYEGELDKILGIVYLKDILLKIRKQEKVEIRQLLRPVAIVPESKPIGQLLKEFQVRHQQMAVVVNEYGSTKGIVTMEDILEELVGEIQDEFDNEKPVVEKIGKDLFAILGTTSVHDIDKQIPVPLAETQSSDTMASYIIRQFGRIPNLLEKIQCGPYEFTIRKKQRSTIQVVQARLLDKENRVVE